MKGAIYDPSTGLVRTFAGGLDESAIKLQVDQGETWKTVPEDFSPQPGFLYRIQGGELVAQPEAD